MKAHRAGDAVAVGDDVGDHGAAEAAHAALFAFLLEQTGLFNAAHAVGMVIVVAHVIERALGNEAQFALVVAHELVAPVFKVHEALVGLGENLAENALIGQTVVVVHEVVEQVVEIHVGLLDDHVAAGKSAESAPVAGALVHHEHVVKKVLGPHGGPHAAEAAADDEKVGRVFVSSGFFHDILRVQLLATSIWSRVRAKRSLKG